MHDLYILQLAIPCDNPVVELQTALVGCVYNDSVLEEWEKVAIGGGCP